ncbi:MAG: T9SS type A sorting domain-containing protein [Bacteroidia bacterium]|nr:T9SS type A sorting domain-containing protein [Bacteroidia bacterium]
MKKQLLTIGSAILLGSIATSLKAQTASLQVIHNCADAAANTVDIYAGTTLLIDDLQFRSASQTFTNIPSGVPIVIGVAAGTSTSSAQSLATFTVNFANGSSNIVVADGIVSPTGYNPGNTTAGFTLNTYSTALSAAPNGTTTSVLVHHGSTDAPIVDIVAPFTGTNPFLPNILVNNAGYGAFAGYLNLAVVDYKIQIRDEFSENVVAEYSAPLQTLGLGGAALTVVASGFLNPANNSNGPAFGLYVATPNGGPLLALPTSTISSTRLQAIHNCADLAANQVDVYVQSATSGPSAIKLIDDFAFRTASSFIDVPVGETISLSIALPTSTSAVGALATFTYNLSATNKYQLIASGIVSGSGYTPNNIAAPFNLTAYTMAKERSSSTSITDVLVYHGSTDAPTVDVVVPFSGTNPFIPNAIVNNASYGAFAGYLNLPTADYKLQIRDEFSENVVAEYSAPLQTLGLNGAALTVVASGFLNPTNNSTGPNFGLYVALPSGGALIALPSSTISSTRLQAIHNSADLAATQVDVYVQSPTSGPTPIRLIDNFAFRTASSFIDVPVGETITLSIALPTSTSAVGALATFTYNLSAANKYQLIASGIVSGSGYTPNNIIAPFNLVANAAVRERALVSTNTDVLVFHGSTDAPTVDVQAQGAGTIVNDMAYGTYNSTGYLQLPSNTAAGDYTLHITDAAGTSTVVSYLAPLNTLSLTSKAITVLASGFYSPSNNSTGPAFGLWVALPTGGNLIPLPVFITTSLKEKNALSNAISVYPNPFNDQININNEANINLDVTILDVTGKIVSSEKSNSNSITINTSELTQGVYIINVKSNELSANYKVVK